MINTILFDLDGTLLPMDLQLFEKLYFETMSKQLMDLIDPKILMKNIWASTMAMVENTEYLTNEEVFMKDFQTRINGDLELYKRRFDEFYDDGFLKAEAAVTKNQHIQAAVALLKEKGYDIVIATNPLFPLKAIEHRIRWAGFEPSDFQHITHYEKSHYCKPQLQYYEEILRNIDKNPEECLMVGNDVQEDLIAGKLGLKTYLIENHMLHRTEEEIITDYKGSYEDFYSFAKALPHISKQ